MYLLYMDESGDAKRDGGSSHLILGGAAVFEGKWAHLDKLIQGLITTYFPGSDRPKELHLNEIRGGKNHFRRLTKLQRATLETDFCGIANSMLANEAVFFGVIADKQLWFAANPGKNGHDLFMDLFEQLTARFDLYLRRKYSDGTPHKGMVIADANKGSVMQGLRDKQRTFQTSGNQWNDVYNLVETVFFLNSEDSPGLQLADLCTYSLWRVATANDDVLARKLSSCFDREPLTSRISPGKWHGVKVVAGSPELQRSIQLIWH